MLLQLIGLLAIVRVLVYYANAVYVRFIQPPNSPKSYGKWSIITGSTDGIGKALAFQLASKGQNLILISRTQAKLDATKSEIQAKHPKVEVQTMAVDFSYFASGTKLYDEVHEIMQKYKDDLGVLYNNVGLAYDFPKLFHELSDKSAQDLITVNVNSLSLMTRLFLQCVTDKKLKREGSPKAAVINIGSGAGVRPLPLLSSYSAAKSYMKMLTDCLAVEYNSEIGKQSIGGSIDFQCHEPMMIVSNMSKLKESNFFVPTSEKYAEYIVDNLGKSVLVSGHFWHAVATELFGLLPKSLYTALVMKTNVPMRERNIG